MRLRGSNASLSFALIFVDDAKKSLCIMEEIHKLKGDFIMDEMNNMNEVTTEETSNEMTPVVTENNEVKTEENSGINTWALNYLLS